MVSGKFEGELSQYLVRRARTATRKLVNLQAEQIECYAERRRAAEQLQIQCGWSLQQIADAFGMTKAAVQKMLAG